MGDGVWVLRGGAVWGHPDCDTVVVRGGTIASVTRSAGVHIAPESAVELPGRSILPGFVDAHVHLLHTGLGACGWTVDLAGHSRDEAVGIVRAAARARGRGEWIIAAGWDESAWKDRTYLDRLELDHAVPDLPVLAVRVDGHLLVANTCALESRESSGVLAKWPQRADRPTGALREEAATALLASVQPDLSTMQEALGAAARWCHREGITSAHTMCDAAAPELFLAAAERLRLRMVVQPPIDRLDALRLAGRRSGDGDAWARFGGLKIFADGSVGAGTAAVFEPRVDGGVGTLCHSDTAMEACVRAADAAGWQTIIHAIGDRAIDQVIRVHETVRTNRTLRHRVEHFEFPSESQVERARAAGLAVCMQPNFIGRWSGPGGLYETALGAERTARSNPLRRVIESGIPLGFGSDGMPISPIYGISCAVGAAHEGQRLTIEEAVEAYTRGGGGLARGEEERGRLEVGMPADLVVLDGPWTANAIGRRAVERTFVGGECVYERTEM